MKYIILICCLLPFFASANDSCYVKNTDKFTGEVKYESAGIFSINNKTSLQIFAGGDKYNKTLFRLQIKNDDIITTDDKSSVSFLFEDNSQQKLINNAGYTLSGTFLLIHTTYKLGGGRKMLAELLSKKVKTIRLTGNFKQIDIDLSDTKAADLQALLNCVFNAWQNKQN